jgi:drug/metabolite transporter (DMT)-like permease
VCVVAVCYAIGPRILATRLSQLPGLGVVAASLGLTALAYLPATIVQWPAQTPPAKGLLAMVLLGLFCTALAFLVFFALIAELGPARAMVIAQVNPAVAAVLGVTLLGEAFTPGMGVGFGLVVAGSVLATQRAAPRLAAETAAA